MRLKILLNLVTHDKIIGDSLIFCALEEDNVEKKKLDFVVPGGAYINAGRILFRLLAVIYLELNFLG